jgi:hypothetical protein
MGGHASSDGRRWTDCATLCRGACVPYPRRPHPLQKGTHGPSGLESPLPAYSHTAHRPGSTHLVDSCRLHHKELGLALQHVNTSMFVRGSAVLGMHRVDAMLDGNALSKDTYRVMILAPWLSVGGADQYVRASSPPPPLTAFSPGLICTSSSN